jgi:hypothetical protein
VPNAVATLPPFELRDGTLRELRATRAAMMSPPWTIAIRGQTAEVRREAALRLVDVQQALLELETAVLADIRDKLLENEAPLRESCDNLRRARQNLAQVRQVLGAIGKLLTVVSRVVRFAATSL